MRGFWTAPTKKKTKKKKKKKKKKTMIDKLTLERLKELNLIKFSKEVTKALTNNLPIIALESTIISHGMPYPQNYKTAQEVENIARQQYNVTPATIAILNGIIHIGLEDDDLLYLAKQGEQCYKTSKRDISYILSNKLNGATTVASTMYLASICQIDIFVTGGIGGVHRGVSNTWDISADLNELGQTNVIVICAGVKSILDINKTLEYLETLGVPVITYSQKHFPSFYTSNSGSLSPLSMNNLNQIANTIYMNQDIIQCSNGMIIAIPNKQYQFNNNNHDFNPDIYAQEISKATTIALNELKIKNITGKYITPYLLERINQLTKGNSLKANIFLIKNNCHIGCQIALKLHQIRQLGLKNQKNVEISKFQKKKSKNQKKIKKKSKKKKSKKKKI